MQESQPEANPKPNGSQPEANPKPNGSQPEANPKPNGSQTEAISNKRKVRRDKLKEISKEKEEEEYPHDTTREGNVCVGDSEVLNTAENNENIKNRLTMWDYEEIQKMWNEICVPVGFNAVKGKIPDTKGKGRNKKGKPVFNPKEAIRETMKRIRLELTDGKTKEEAKQVLRSVFEKVCRSNYLRGFNANEWKAAFIWVFKDDNLMKIYRGEYDNEPANEK